jgi:dimeric dUTPase (all-alpha-NTP-PPase superfamily)
MKVEYVCRGNCKGEISKGKYYCPICGINLGRERTDRGRCFCCGKYIANNPGKIRIIRVGNIILALRKKKCSRCGGEIMFSRGDLVKVLVDLKWVCSCGHENEFRVKNFTLRKIRNVIEDEYMMKDVSDEDILLLKLAYESVIRKKKGDKLDEMLRKQRMYSSQLSQKIGRHKRGDEKRIEALAEAIIQEACELQNLTNWKWWKRTKKEFDVEKAREELIDIVHFVLDVALVLGMSADDIYREYIKKNEINLERLKNGY